MDDVTFLRKLPVFRPLTEEGARKLIARAEVRTFAPETIILKKGDPGDSMFVLKRGSVRVPLTGSGDGRRFDVFLGPGDFFGEMALLTGEPRRADVVADGEVPVECLVFPKEAVATLLKEEPKIARFLTEILGKRLLSSGLKKVGKYQIMGELGRGGGAIVYEGFHPGLQRPVAIKMLSHDLVYEGDFADRFIHEAQLIADLRHENIVQVYDIEQAYATFFIVMERLDGTELKGIVDESAATPEETKHILRQVARALQYAHRKGIVHQDVKPSNIFVESTGRVKLMDFGIAGAPMHEGSGDVAQGVMGTPGYIAPEVMYGGPVDGRADIYALGVVAYELLTGRIAFDHHSKVDVLRSQLSTEKLALPEPLASRETDLARFIEQATAKDPADRFTDCARVLEHLDEPPAHLDPGRADGRVLSVLFDRRDRARVEEVLAEVADKLAAVPGARVALADLKPLE